VQEPYDIDQYDYSVLTKRTLDQIAGDAGAREWESNRPAAATGRSTKNDWLADSIAKADKAKRKAAPKVAKSVASKKAAPAKSVSAKKAASTGSAVKKKSSPKKRLSR
jgi:hypothetical protein